MQTHPHSIWLIRRNLEIYKNKLLHKYWQTKKLHVMKKVKIFLHIYVYVIHIMQYACIGRKKLTLILWWKLFPPFCAFSNWIFWHTLHPYPVLGKPSLKKSHKTANFFRTSLSPPPSPPPRIYGHLWGSFFLNARTGDS